MKNRGTPTIRPPEIVSMATELRRGFIRIASNYTRLLLTLMLGVFSVPILFRAVGTDGFGLISLIVGATGIVLIIVETVNSSLTYEVGKAWHSNDVEFREVYASANIVAAIVASATSLLFVGFYFALPLLSIDESLLDAARWMILLQMADNFVRVLTAAPNNFFMITERFVAQNIIMTLRRSAILIGALAALGVYGGQEQEKALVLFAIVQVSINNLVQFVAVAWAFLVDRRAIPRFSYASKPGMRRVFSTAKWNAAALGASTIQLQIDQLLMNLLFGLFGNAVFGLAQRLAAYVRMIVNGMSVGIDAVTVRLNSGGESELRIKDMLRHSTRLHAVALMPAMLYLLLYSNQVFHVWIASSVENPEQTIPTAVVVVFVLLFGMGARAMSDNWTAILYGAGHVRKYAPLIVAGAALNPVLVLVFWKILPSEMSIVSPAAGFTTIMVLFHFVGIPMHVTRRLHVSWGDVYIPMLRPLILAAVSLPVVLFFNAPAESWSIIRLLGSMATYGAVYVVMCVLFELSSAERNRIARAIRRQVIGRVSSA